MATLEADFKTYLMADASVKTASQGRISQNELPATPILPYVWFQWTGEDVARDLSSSGVTPGMVSFAVECVGQSASNASALATVVQARLESGGPVTFGTRTCTVFCERPGDSYEPRPGGPGASGFHIVGLNCDVWRNS